MSQHNPSTPSAIELHLIIRDVEIIESLLQYEEGNERNRHAISALGLGLRVLRQASGMVDADTVRNEGETILASLRALLTEKSTEALHGVGDLLKRFFDPESGLLPQRLENLTKEGGELETLLGRHLEGDGSTISRVLEEYVGKGSELFRVLSPEQKDGLLATLKKEVESALEAQRQVILRQFSLDDKESALSRLIAGVTDSNGDLRKELAGDIELLKSEFSLDNEDGVLTRMSQMISRTQRQVEASLTLDDEGSALSRMNRELKKLVNDQAKANQEFQADVRATLEALNARKRESDRSTRRGDIFETRVGEFVRTEAQRLGDIFQSTGSTTGVRPHCKVGDFVVELGPDAVAAGARITLEAKDRQGVDLKCALDEVRTARENRQAQVGIFVYSRAAAPEGIEPLERYGSDMVAVWDPEEVTTDAYLKAALSLARFMVIAEAKLDEAKTADFAEIERAIERIVKDAQRVDEIIKSATTVENGGRKIRDTAERIQRDLEKQVDTLREHIESLKGDAAAAPLQASA